MSREKLDSGEPFEARTVVDRVDFAADTRFSLPLALVSELARDRARGVDADEELADDVEPRAPPCAALNPVRLRPDPGAGNLLGPFGRR